MVGWWGSEVVGHTLQMMALEFTLFSDTDALCLVIFFVPHPYRVTSHTLLVQGSPLLCGPLWPQNYRALVPWIPAHIPSPGTCVIVRWLVLIQHQGFLNMGAVPQGSLFTHILRLFWKEKQTV